jgi:hypothetical protein
MLANDTITPIPDELPTGVSFPLRLDDGGDRLLTRKETARLLRLSEGYLRHKGPKLLPIVRLGTAVRHRLSDVLALIERRTVTAAGEADPRSPPGRQSDEGDEGLPPPAGPGSPEQVG